MCGHVHEHGDEEAARRSVAQPMLLRQFVDDVIEYSSQLGDEQFAAKRLRGKPAVFPRHYYDAAAWCPKEARTANEFVEVRFARKVRVAAIELFETWNAGAVKSIKLRHPDGEWVTVYAVEHVECIRSKHGDSCRK